MIQALYVDDEQDLLQISKLYLERTHDMTVDTELSAPQALTKLKSKEYDVVISDYQMPEMDGIRFLKNIRTECKSKIPFILFTGRGREEVAIDALNSGADFYLQKGGDVKAQFAILKNMVLQAAQKKQAEDELRQSEERYRNIVEDQMESICRFRPDGTHVFVNSIYCTFLGKTRTDLIGKKFFPNIPPEDRVQVKKHFRSLTLQNPRASIEHRIIMPDGSVRWVRCNDRAIFDRKGNVIEYQSVARDITIQKKAEFAREESERRLRYILDFFPDAFYAIDLTGTVIAWNKAAEDLTGIPAGQMIGKGNYEYSVAFYGTRRPALVDIILDPGKKNLSPYADIQNTEGAALIAESRVDLKDGRRTMIRIKAAPFYDCNGEITGAIESVHDVSSYKHLENELHLANNKLNLLNMVTRHGVLNKITALSGYLEMAKDRIADTETSGYLEKVQALVTAIGEQMDFTRHYQDLGVKTPLWQDVNEQFMYAISHIDLKECTCTRDLRGLEIYADPLLEQVFVNLIENSLLHGMDASKIHCSFRCNGNTVTIQFEDNGPGIPALEKERIFNQGYGRNTGLGLFLTREILAITGIMIRETGEPGKGSRFEILVPPGNYRITGGPEKNSGVPGRG